VLFFSSPFHFSLPPHSLLSDLGVNYDPDRLSRALADRQIYSKGAQVALVFGEFIGKLLTEVATGTVESNAPKRARELRDCFR
jgi:hypothetical protein